MRQMCQVDKAFLSSLAASKSLALTTCTNNKYISLERGKVGDERRSRIPSTKGIHTHRRATGPTSYSERERGSLGIGKKFGGRLGRRRRRLNPMQKEAPP